jgi:hypothetical protein
MDCCCLLEDVLLSANYNKILKFENQVFLHNTVVLKSCLLKVV